MAKIVAIANQKGGVGKTTTAINLAACLAETGKKVLTIDLDPQGNMTSGLGVDKNNVENTLYELMLDECSIKESMTDTVVDGMKVIPSNVNLAGAEIELLGIPEKEYILRNAVDYIKEDYDFMIIDCMPSLGMLTINALTAADSVLIPMEPEYYAADGLMELLKVYSAIKAKFNPDLKIEGIVFTFDTPTFNNSKRNKKAVISTYGDKIRIFKESIPRAVTIAETASEGISIFAYDGSGKGAQSYQKLVEGVLDHA